MSIKEDAKTSRWDTAEFLKTKEDIDAYLEVAFESKDPRHIAKAIGNAARAQGMMDIARKTGLNRESLYSGLSESGNPTLKTVTAVMDSLGYDLTPVRRKKARRLHN